MPAPLFKILEGPSSANDGISNAVSVGLAPIISVASKAADVFAHDYEGLLQILRFRNQTAKAAHRRSGWIGGRIFNKFSGEDTNYIPVSGTHLRQALAVVGIEAPEFIVASGKYSLRLDLSEEAVLILFKTRDNLKADA